ncbi:hypothetical protein LHU53_10850 [Rhodoferax sp. U2-2l]|uniref:hypothetical protein n=1 Tax=Rhodoferax sp. U2-2l TaxID=2884000 RepID=UPI001D0AB66A|nr:hypothetical protein [Rhodoferax sp. U2-2l]MCB8747405.1 hypothetical protein [Rhodoferax sp. U2-2l]
MSTEKPQPNATPNMLRRKLFKGAYGGVGVLMAVQAKTALGGNLVDCRSPSAMISGNMSQRPDTGISCSGGRSPGFWKVPQKFEYWAGTGATPPTFKSDVYECASGMKGLTLDNVATPGTLLTNIGFAGATGSVWAALAFPKSGEGGQLLRHLASAWLNAGYFQSNAAQYPLTKTEIIAMWNATKSGGTYCPASMSCSESQRWTPAKVIEYIESLYDFNSDVADPQLCTKGGK